MALQDIELPYVFDLMHDIKNMDQLYCALSGQSVYHKAKEIRDLRKMCRENDIQIDRKEVRGYTLP
jgi:hypothetical protein